jgi:hypothetical protein
VRKDAENDDEDNRGRDPGPEFVYVHNLVAEEGYHQSADSDDDDAGESRADDGVDGGPAEAGKDVENRNCDTLAEVSQLGKNLVTH